MIDQNKIKEAIDRLVKTYNPIKIYLFGSYAWGKPNKDSDLDFFIVIKKSNENFPARAVKGYLSLIGLEIPKDIIVYTLNEFEENKEDSLTLCHKIYKEGKVVYEIH